MFTKDEKKHQPPVPPAIESLKQKPYQQEVSDMQYEGGPVSDSDDGIPKEEKWYIHWLECLFCWTCKRKK